MVSQIRRTGLDRIGRTGNIRHVVLLVLLGVRVEWSGGRRLVNAWNRWCYPVMTMGNIIMASDVRCYSKKSGNWNLSWQALKLQNTSTTCLKATCGLFSASHGDWFGCIMDGWIPALHTDAHTSLRYASDLLDRLCCGWASLWHFHYALHLQRIFWFRGEVIQSVGVEILKLTPICYLS